MTNVLLVRLDHGFLLCYFFFFFFACSQCSCSALSSIVQFYLFAIADDQTISSTPYSLFNVIRAADRNTQLKVEEH